MKLSRSSSAVAVVAAALVPSLLLATPAHATNYPVTYNTATGFGTQTVTVNSTDTITVTNATPLPVTMISSWGQVAPAVPGNGGTAQFTVTTPDFGTITAVGAGAQPVLVAF